MSGWSLEVEGLRRTYGTVTALDDLSFEVPAGQVVGFLGPNGAGKTTTMRAIFGLTDLDAGPCAGTARRSARPSGAVSATCPRNAGLYPGMLVGEQVEYLGRLHGLGAAEAAARHRPGWSGSTSPTAGIPRWRRCLMATSSGCS